MTGRLPTMITDVEPIHPPIKACVFNQHTVPTLLRAGWLVAFEDNLDGTVKGYLRPNGQVKRRNGVRDGDVIICFGTQLTVASQEYFHDHYQVPPPNPLDTRSVFIEVDGSSISPSTIGGSPGLMDELRKGHQVAT